MELVYTNLLTLLILEASKIFVFIINKGTKKIPDWEIHELNLSQIDVGNYSTPSLKDLDNDGDLDMLVGNRKGFIIYYENKGNKNLPHFVLRSTRFTGLSMNANSAPTFWKWNKDKYPDLVVGNRQGFISLISHIPPDNSPVFRGWNLLDSNWQNIKSVGNSTPHFADFDKDNKTDFMMGDKDGNLIFWKNNGLKKSKIFEKDKELELNKNSLELETKEKNEQEEEIDLKGSISDEVNINNEPFLANFEFVSSKFGNLDLGPRPFPAFMDIDGDDKVDLVVGNKSGELRYYRQNNNLGKQNWSLETLHFLDYKGSKNLSPVFADLDGDNDLDLLVGNQEGIVEYWENKGNFEIPEFVYNPTPFLGVNGGRNSDPAVIDLDSDGLNDIIVGNLLGRLYEFYRENSSSGFRFRLVRRKYLDLDVGLGSVPKLADINNDNLPELIVGSDSGRILFFKIKKNKSGKIEWETGPKYLKDQKLPIGGNPVFVDIDLDGDLDLIIGSEEGTLHHYRNTGY